jgi:hypothetical protein
MDAKQIIAILEVKRDHEIISARESSQATESFRILFKIFTKKIKGAQIYNKAPLILNTGLGDEECTRDIVSLGSALPRTYLVQAAVALLLKKNPLVFLQALAALAEIVPRRPLAPLPVDATTLANLREHRARCSSPTPVVDLFPHLVAQKFVALRNCTKFASARVR